MLSFPFSLCPIVRILSFSLSRLHHILMHSRHIYRIAYLRHRQSTLAYFMTSANHVFAPLLRRRDSALLLFALLNIIWYKRTARDISLNRSKTRYNLSARWNCSFHCCPVSASTALVYLLLVFPIQHILFQEYKIMIGLQHLISYSLQLA